SSLATSSDGTVWAATRTGLDRMPPTGLRTVSLSGPAGAPVESVFRDHAGRLWMASRDVVVRLDGDRLVPVRGLPAGLTRAVAEDSRASWVANWEHGLFRVSNTDDVEGTPWAALGHDDPVTAMAADPERTGAWLGFAGGGIVDADGGRVRASFAPSD